MKRRPASYADPRARIAELVAQTTGRALEEVRAEVYDQPAPVVRDGQQSARAQVRAHDERVAELAADDDAQPGATIAEPMRRLGLDAPVQRSAFLSRARAEGRAHMAPLDWRPSDFAASRGASSTGSAARRACAGLPPELAARVRRAALAELPGPDGIRRPTRGWSHIIARRIVALAVVMWRASRSCRRRGMARVLVGRVRGQFGTLFTNPHTGAPYSLSTFFRTSVSACRRGEWDCGDVVALHRARALWRCQPPAASVAPEFSGRDRSGVARAFNEYHFPRGVVAVAVERDEETARRPRSSAARSIPPVATAPPS